MCVDLSDYNRYLNQIWYRTQIRHYQHAGMTKIHSESCVNLAITRS